MPVAGRLIFSRATNPSTRDALEPSGRRQGGSASLWPRLLRRQASSSPPASSRGVTPHPQLCAESVVVFRAVAAAPAAVPALGLGDGACGGRWNSGSRGSGTTRTSVSSSSGAALRAP
ncbi:hypothetical protein PVAP13_4KG359400 [Panicum virgatum]|uniref:Uncharacterized protein n=1 Tax=Panicum virgatum TaxID=38727 RepID=A0A8T0TX78_PANVG|nr:hypothetical protein PVAP13_4KG359400 [Panicum virgatum]KAG2613563.1 hypothetical protein PVAP13_4KG359400 [Panicum virgatum]